MKKLIAIIMVIAMVAGFVPTVLAVPAENTTEIKNKADVFGENTLQTHEMYGVDQNGKMAATGKNPTRATDGSEVSKEYQTLSIDKVKSQSWWDDSINYGVPFIDQAESLIQGYQCEHSDFKPNTDFLQSGKKVYGMFFTPADGLMEIKDDGDTGHITKFNKGDKFWFNFSLISGYGSNGPNFYASQVIMSVYMYSGTLQEFQNGGGGLKQKASWTAYNRVSVNITAPANNTIYMFYVVVKEADMQAGGANNFGGWLTISDHDKNIKDLEVKETIVPEKDYELNLDRDGVQTLLYGSDESAGYVLAPAALYKVDLKAGHKYCIVPEGDGSNGVRIMMLDENKDILYNSYLGTQNDGYQTITCPIFPVVDGTYYFIVAGFMYTDGGRINFSIRDYNDVQPTNPYMDYLPEVKDVEIDLENLVDGTIETIDGVDAWGYFYSDEANMGILSIVLPGTYRITGENRNCLLDIYDSVCVELENVTCATILTSGTWGAERIHAIGTSKAVDGFWGAAIQNDEGFTGVYITGDDMSIIGEKECGGLMECATHISCKHFTAEATLTSGIFPVAFWVTGFMGQKLTFPSDAKITNGKGQTLKRATLYFDQDHYYLNGYSVSQYDTLVRIQGSPDYYSIADYFEIGSAGGQNPTPPPSGDPSNPPTGDYLLGDANLDGKVNTGDATLVLKHSAGMTTISEEKACIQADVNQDGKINTGDATYILKIAAGMVEIPKYDPNKP